DVWKDTKAIPDGKDNLALRAAKKFFVGVSQVAELADAMMLYAIALNRCTAAGLAEPTGTDLAQFSSGQFEGFSGTVIINEYHTRDPVFLVYGLNSSNQQIVMLKITERAVNGNSTLIQDVQPPSVMWASRGGSPPRNRPLCDFNGSACPPTFVEKYLAITLVAVIVPVCILIMAIIVVLRYRKLEEERLNELWKIPFNTLKKRNTKIPEHRPKCSFDAQFNHDSYQVLSKFKNEHEALLLLSARRGFSGGTAAHLEACADEAELCAAEEGS
uniref:ANF_receptor domain-containing protein n=1 Tax=Angiostrongylus cantonensis TaxID=6313 RepID=A0A0K0D2W5_ANGCA